MNSKKTISNIKFKWIIFSHISSIDQNGAIYFSLIRGKANFLFCVFVFIAKLEICILSICLVEYVIPSLEAIFVYSSLTSCSSLNQYISRLALYILEIFSTFFSDILCLSLS